MPLSCKTGALIYLQQKVLPCVCGEWRQWPSPCKTSVSFSIQNFAPCLGRWACLLLAHTHTHLLEEEGHLTERRGKEHLWNILLCPGEHRQGQGQEGDMAAGWHFPSPSQPSFLAPATWFAASCYCLCCLENPTCGLGTHGDLCLVISQA